MNCINVLKMFAALTCGDVCAVEQIDTEFELEQRVYLLWRAAQQLICAPPITAAPWVHSALTNHSPALPTRHHTTRCCAAALLLYSSTIKQRSTHSRCWSANARDFITRGAHLKHTCSAKGADHCLTLTITPISAYRWRLMPKVLIGCWGWSRLRIG